MTAPAGDGPLPPLRSDLDIQAVQMDGKEVFLVSDREGLSEKTLGLSPGGMAVASLLDGRLSAAEIRELVQRETGALLPLAQIHGLVRELETSSLLETAEVARRRLSLLEEFRASPVRPTALPGAYPEQTLELAKFLGAFFRDGKGPGESLPEAPSEKAPPLGLLCPHIDLHRGGPAYAWAYRALALCPPPDAIVALGVAHSSPPSPWVLTRKAYATPYGPLPVHEELYGLVADALWYDPTADEGVHRREHSLEFQALWLKFLWREAAPPWVPILCSSFERFSPDRPPSSVPTVEEALRSVGERLARRKERILILAGVDFAHVGPRFGDAVELTPELERRIEAEDRASLEHAAALEADRFYMSVLAGGHWRHVCGLSATYTALRWMRAVGGEKARTGRLLTYGQAPDPAGGIVSFASLVYPR